jgi:phosphomevalonate kinase
LIRTSAPLKLVIAGEWAVSELRNSAVAAAIKIRIFCEIEPNPQQEIEISLPDFNINNITANYKNNRVIFNQDLPETAKNHLKIIQFTIETALFILEEFKPFKMRIWTEKPASLATSSEIKLDLGSTAAAIVAIHAAIRAFHGILPTGVIEKDELFKLCLLTQYLIQDMNGSGIDVAASFYGSVIRYSRFDPDWITAKLEDNCSPEEFIAFSWPNLSVDPLPSFPELHLLLGWTQSPASTSRLEAMNGFKQQNPALYYTIISEISKLVNEFVKDWKKRNRIRLLSNIQLNELHLRKLSESSGIPIETPQLKLLSQIANQLGGAGKLSDTGDVDCGIAVCFEDATASRILDEWRTHGIIGNQVEIDYDGLIIESVGVNQIVKTLWKKSNL